MAKSPMTAPERDLARRLGRCRFSPATFDKRFSRELAAKAEEPQATLSDNEREWMRYLEHRYRKQLSQMQSKEGE